MQEALRKYSNESFTGADVNLVLSSIMDNSRFLSNRDPVERMIYYLKSIS